MALGASTNDAAIKLIALALRAEGSLAEGYLATYQDVADELANRCVLKATNSISDRRASRGVRASGRSDDLIWVGVDDEIGVVGNYDSVALGLRHSDPRFNTFPPCCAIWRHLATDAATTHPDPSAVVQARRVAALYLIDT